MSLDTLAIKHGTDKSSLHHNYTPIYEHYFSDKRNTPITLVEIGFGGYAHYDRGGQSARMWKDYFYKGRIISIDLYDKKPIEGIEFYQGSQVDEEFLKSIVIEPDVIIDDASHNSKLTTKSFEILFPLLKSDGTYVLEDLESAYWDNAEFEGGLNNPNSSMNFLKYLTDTLNEGHSGLTNKFNIDSIHFHRKIVFIKKK